MKIPAWELRSTSTASLQDFNNWLLQQPLAAAGDGQSLQSTLGPDDSALLIVSDAPVDQRDSATSIQLASGAAAKMLDAMLQAIGQSRRSCRLASLVAPGLLSGLIEEIKVNQILVQEPPRVVLFFAQPEGGRGTEGVSSLRNRIHGLGQAGTKCIVSYHPDYLLLHPELKRHAWDDLKQVRDLLGVDADLASGK